MTISRRNWSLFLCLALVSFLFWYKFTYPQFSFVDLSIEKAQAEKIAKDFLLEKYGSEIHGYQSVVEIRTDQSADRYLQRFIGFKKELEFFKKHDFEIFFYTARFFKENEKEQFFVTVSSATGEITGFHHVIKESAARALRSEEYSKKKVIQFLKDKFGFNPDHYHLRTNLTTKFDNRTNYSFSWEKKDVFIRWSDKENTGGAKLVIGAVISGDEILSFNKHSLKLPNEFSRYVAKKKDVGRNFAIIIRITFFIILTASIFFVVVRRNDLVMHTVKKFCIALTLFLFSIQFLCYFNEIPSILYRYPTTSSMSSYLWRYFSSVFFDLFIVTISILMPSLAGESLHYETSVHKKEGSFLHYLISTFLSRSVFGLICLGYIIAIVLIGIQSILFEMGKHYLGVWVEYIWLSQFSASLFPFFTIFVFGMNAAFSEELTFRLFSINLGKKFLKNSFLAVLIPALIWGFGHSTYPVFPMWFRGLEVTCLGLFLSWIYLRYGIICVIVAHYVFDVFWAGSSYLLGKSSPYLFYGTLTVLLLPFLLGVIAFLRNKKEEERDMAWRLTKHQRYNLNILKDYLKDKKLLVNKSEEELQALKKEIMSHGWDIAVVELAFNEIKEN